MTRRLPVLCALVLAAAMLGSSLLAGPNEKRMAAAMRGQWDMSKDPHRYAVYMVIEQDTNMYPSFWAGTNHEGVLDIDAKEDFLGGTLEVDVKGPFSVALTRAPARHGIASKLPGGTWIAGLSETPVIVRFDRFTNWQWAGAYTGKEDRGIETTVDFTGALIVGERKTAIRGQARVAFSEMRPAFKLAANFSFKGANMGLTGEQAGEQRVTLHTVSIASTKKNAPTLDDRLHSDDSPPLLP